MNLWFLSRFSRASSSNAIMKMIREMRSHSVFKRARFDVYSGTLKPKKMVVLLGQVHTVWKGKIGNRERNMIVRCQARLCSYYAFFEGVYDVRSFGGEGIYEGLNTSFHDQFSFQLYQQQLDRLEISLPVDIRNLPEVSTRILNGLAHEWHDQLRRQTSLERIQQLAGAVSGQSLFQFLNGRKVEVFPVEGQQAYRKVLMAINALGAQIEKLESTESFRYVKQRGGNIKTEKEAQVIQQYNALVKEFNHMIGSDIRERATFEILKERAEQERVVVFTMGVGHRSRYLQLANEYFSDQEIAFVFITPPELLPRWKVIIGVPLLVLITLLFVSWFLGT